MTIPKPPDWILRRLKPPTWAVAWVARQGDLHAVNLSGRDLSGANFRGANLGEADFGSAKMRHASFLMADLDSANFTGANLSSTTNFVYGLRLAGVYRQQGVPEAPLYGSDGMGTSDRQMPRRQATPEDTEQN